MEKDIFKFIKDNLHEVEQEYDILKQIENLIKSKTNTDTYCKWIEYYHPDPIFCQSYNSESSVFRIAMKLEHVFVLICDSYWETGDIVNNFARDYKDKPKLIFCKADKVTYNSIWRTLQDRIKLIDKEDNISFIVTNYKRRDNIKQIFDAMNKILVNKRRNVFVNINTLRYSINSEDPPDYIDSRNLEGRSLCNFCDKDFKNTPKSRSFHKTNCKKIPESLRKDKKFKDWYIVCAYRNT